MPFWEVVSPDWEEEIFNLKLPLFHHGRGKVWVVYQGRHELERWRQAPESRSDQAFGILNVTAQKARLSPSAGGSQ